MQRLTKSQSLFMVRPEVKRPRICSTTRRWAESQALKNSLRHANAHQVSKPVYGETRSQAYQDLLDHAKASRIPSIEEFTKACKGSPSLKTCLWRDQKSSVSGSAQPREGEQNPKHWRNLLRHAKAHQVSKPISGETRSQACQDLLDHAKASSIPKHQKIY